MKRKLEGMERGRNCRRDGCLVNEVVRSEHKAHFGDFWWVFCDLKVPNLSHENNLVMLRHPRFPHPHFRQSRLLDLWIVIVGISISVIASLRRSACCADCMLLLCCWRPDGFWRISGSLGRFKGVRGSWLRIVQNAVRNAWKSEAFCWNVTKLVQRACAAIRSDARAAHFFLSCRLFAASFGAL